MNINDLEKENFNMCENPGVVSLKTNIETEDVLGIGVNEKDVNDLFEQSFNGDKINIVQEVEI